MQAQIQSLISTNEANDVRDQFFLQDASPDAPLVADLTALETRMLIEYTNNLAFGVNSQLRRGGFPDLPAERRGLSARQLLRNLSSDDNTMEVGRQKYELLKSALNKFPNYHGTVYRYERVPGPDVIPGTPSLEQVLAQLEPGSVMTRPEFLSTTKCATVDEIGLQKELFDGPIRYAIESKTGKDITNYSVRPNEKEILFHAGTSFAVMDKQFNAADGHWYVKLVEQ